MGAPFYDVWLTPFGAGMGSINVTDNVLGFKCDNSIEKAGGFSMKVHDPQGYFIGSFNYGATLNIKVGDNLTGLESGTIMYGIISEQSPRLSSNHSYSVNGRDYAAKLLDFLVLGQSYSEDSELGEIEGETGDFGTNVVGSVLNSRIVIKHIMRENYRSDGIDELDYDTYVDPDRTCKGWATVSAFETAGSDFHKSFSQKTISETFKEISGKNFTGTDDNFIIYVDSERNLHFEPRPGKYYEGVISDGDFLSLDLTRNVDDQYTAIMVNAGDDWDGDPIYCAGYNLSAIGRSGWKWGYVDRKGFFVRAAKTMSGTYDADEIKAVVKDLGRAEATRIAEEQGFPKWRGKVTLKGTNAYTIGSAYNVVIDSKYFNRDATGAVPIDLRLIGVEHSFDDKGWFTSLDLKEDYGEIF